MSDHLTFKEIKNPALLAIKGDRRIRLLRHLEACAVCRELIFLPSRAEILKRLGTEAPDLLFTADPAEQRDH